ncbi:hypothetical protein MVEN_00953100 [Mycena venus]|uniref:Uncharacterized protein n=1 Tax=Mycena venus TaxID=2733690 RepID=A0A8H7D1Q9_9AGAR|nr:hypothetical protein MVEN_00953100 [Mycena venus]
MDLPQDILEAIVDELEETKSLRAFCLVAPSFVQVGQARIFRAVQIQTHGFRKDGFRIMSPLQAERLFSVSPHLALYVQRLWIHIPRPRLPFDPHVPALQIPARAPDWYPPLQAILPAFSRVRELSISAPEGRRWGDLPEALKDVMQGVMILSTLQHLEFITLSVPATLITSVALSVPALSLDSVVIEEIRVQSSQMAVPKEAFGALTLRNITESMVKFLATPGALPSQRLSIIHPEKWADISKILTGTAATLTQLCLRFHNSLGAGPLPRHGALRMLELDTSAGPAPYCLPNTLLALLRQIPTVMPRLEHLTVNLTVATKLRSASKPRENVRWVDESAWVHDEPLDLGPVDSVYCRLRFDDYTRHDGPEQVEERRELHESVSREFVQCMGEQLPALRDNGGLSFSRIPLR